MKQPLKETLKRIGGDRLLKESTWANRKFGEPLPTMADYKKLKEDQGDIQTVVKINLRVNLDATIEGNEEDALKFKKDVEEKIQSVIDDYKAEATWRLD